MQNRPEVTAMLSLSIQRHICPNSDPRIYWAREVTFDYATTNAVRVDFMKFKPVNNTVSGIEKGDFYCYEVKSSVDDFHSKNGHNFLGDYNYYVMPEEVYEQVKKEIPYQVGVYVPDGMNYRGEWYGLKAIKKAKRKDRSRPVSRNGYSKDSPEIVCKCTLQFGEGKPEWGAEPGKMYYVLKIQETGGKQDGSRNDI